ncbi:MAG: MFS transporter [Candidatus Korarchaeota archaeon]
MIKNYMILISSFFLGIGNGFIWSFSSYILHLDLPTYVSVGIATSFSSITMALFSPIWGRIFDRTHRTRLLLCGGILGFAMALCSLILAETPYLFFPLYFGGFAIFSIYGPISSTFLSLTFRNKIVAISTNLAIINFGAAIGAFIGGILMEVSVATAVLWNSVLSLISLIAIFNLPSINNMEKNSEENNGTLSKRMFILLVGGVFIIVIAAGMFNTFFAIYYMNDLGGNISLFGTTYSMMLVVGGIAILIYGIIAKNGSPEFVVFLSTLLYFTSIVGVLLITDPILVMIVWALPCFPAVTVGSYGIAVKYSDPKIRGFAIGVASFILNCAGIGGIIGGVILDCTSVNFRLLFRIALIAVILAATIIYFFISVARDKNKFQSMS